jgi:hypothetical protein
LLLHRHIFERKIQLPQSVIKHALISAAIIGLLSGCGSVADGGSSSGGRSSDGSNGARNITVSWIPPIANTDESVLEDLAGYRIYYGTASRDYSDSSAIDNPGLSSFVVEGLGEATWCFVMTAINEQGIESSYSEEVCLMVTTS